MCHIFNTSANETISEEIGDYYPIFHNVFAQFAQSAETLQKALQHTDRKRQFVVYQKDRSTIFYSTIYDWKRKGIFLKII